MPIDESQLTYLHFLHDGAPLCAQVNPEDVALVGLTRRWGRDDSGLEAKLLVVKLLDSLSLALKLGYRGISVASDELLQVGKLHQRLTSAARPFRFRKHCVDCSRLVIERRKEGGGGIQD